MTKRRVLIRLLVVLWIAQGAVVSTAAYITQDVLFTEGFQRPDQEMCEFNEDYAYRYESECEGLGLLVRIMYNYFLIPVAVLSVLIFLVNKLSKREVEVMKND